MRKLGKITLGIIGLTVASFICNYFFEIQPNAGRLFFYIGGLTTGVIISDK
jgi:uncharacterized membrane protein YeaQ/YmgE (transglycosylase-associated protein family)